VNISVLANDTDVDDAALSILSVNSPPSHGTATIIGNVIRYTPGAGFSGSDSFSYIAIDGSGATDSATVTVTVVGPLSWDGGGDGVSWFDPLNWSTNTVPDADDNVVINLPGTYSIVLSADVEVASLLWVGPSGLQTLALGTHALTVGGSVTIADNGLVTLSDADIIATTLNILDGGALRGTGLVTGNLNNSGLLQPDSLTINGHFTQTATGVSALEVRGPVRANLIIWTSMGLPHWAARCKSVL
jgi:hypothetical protein